MFAQEMIRLCLWEGGACGVGLVNGGGGARDQKGKREADCCPSVDCCGAANMDGWVGVTRVSLCFATLAKD